MEHQTIVNIIFAALLGLIGWLGRTVWDAVQRFKDDLNRLEVDMATTYVRKSDIESRFDRIDQTLERLFDKLDNKVDKKG